MFFYLDDDFDQRLSSFFSTRRSNLYNTLFTASPPPLGFSSKKFIFVGTPISGVSSASSGGQAGAVDEELFQQSFEDVKPITFLTSRSLQVSFYPTLLK
jgi:hypothetical protein